MGYKVHSPLILMPKGNGVQKLVGHLSSTPSKTKARQVDQDVNVSNANA